jgi:DNA mismatch repair protein MutS
MTETAPLRATASKAARTPLMEQYRRAKAEHPDAFLFFRLGDFYEMFLEDAVEGARLLGLTLTSRNKNDPDPIPMCGIPWHQRDGYVARLLRLGRKVAICDQLEDASVAKGLVQRGVTEVLTPGSVVGEGFLEPAANNFLAALWADRGGMGLCLADASTAEVKLAESSWEEAAGLLASLRVSEWLLPTSAEGDAAARLDTLTAGLPGARTRPGEPVWRDRDAAHARWPDAAPLLASLPRAAVAASAAVAYLDRVQGGTALRPARVERWGADELLRYDAATARHLELFQPQPGGEPAHTLWHHLDLTVTSPGARRLRAWIERPLRDGARLLERQEAVAAWMADDVGRGAFRDLLRGLPDLERLAARVAVGKATPRDLGALRDTLQRLPGLAEGLAAIAPAAVAGAREALVGAPALAARLAAALVDEPPPVANAGGIIRTGFDPYRDRLHDASRSGKRWIAELEAGERARTGITSLKVGFNRVFGYYLEVTRPHLDKVPSDYERRQTLTTAERFVTPELKAKESEVLGAEDRLQAREQELFTQLREEAAQHVPALQSAADALARLDAQASLAEAAARYGWVRPALEDSDRLTLLGARHPVVERLLPRGEFVPNDVGLDATRRQILLLTGPNMGGKSTYLRQVAIIVLLAQAGSWVPAQEAVIGLVDRLFTRVGAADRLGAGQSTFMVEMQETADILRNATSRSLVLLDEIGRGTATYDGLALAWAVTEHLHAADGPRPRTIFATHYHELTQLAERLGRLANVHVTVRESGDGIVFLHRIADGAADRSYGIHVAQLAGLPERVLSRAREVLHELESERTAEHLGAADGGRGFTVGSQEAAAVVREKPSRRARAADAAPELPLFGVAEHPLAEELRRVTPETLTPLEALNRIAEWKKKYGG